MVSLLEIFTAFAKIGAFTIGGGYMMVPAIEAEILKKGWIDKDEMPDIVALSQSAPGLLTVNMAIFCGHRLRGVKGSVAATLGAIAAPVVIILLAAMFFSSIRDNRIMEAMFMGVRPVAVAIIAAYTLKLLKRHSRWWEWGISLLAMGAIALLKISPIYILIVVMAAAVAAGLAKGKKWRG